MRDPSVDGRQTGATKGLPRRRFIATACARASKKIVNQMIGDPRVVDVYLQRSLMLAESGLFEAIKPVWLQRVLEAQMKDGGWGDFYLLSPTIYGHSIGFNSHRLRLLNSRQIKSSFHATAQGIFLLSLVLGNEGIGKFSPEK